eukprot:GHVQ01023875.1.p2 GENE.GHVQ01023875.1~~GHVQ01023875.1.p2  ORF type:complete len:254 (-),score=11.98 GHVQ01023875.1:1246-2007(-)
MRAADPATSPIMGPASPYHDVELGDECMDPKLDRSIRHGFIRKVYGIVGSQLLSTFLVSALLMTSVTLKDWALSNATPLLVICGIGSFVVLCYLMCAAGASTNYPTNYALLGVFTLLESCLVGLVTCVYDVDIVLQAFLATSVMVIGLTLFAFQTDYDFTSWMGALFYVLLGFMVFGLLRVLFWRSQLITIIYSAGLAVIFSIYLLVDTQLLIGRKKLRLDEDDYILAALTIYLDVINLFLSLLRLLQSLRDS